MKNNDSNIRMTTNNTNKKTNKSKLIFPELSYMLTGICFDIHNTLGRFSKEKQYCDVLEEKLKDSNVIYERELKVKNSGNILDFLIDNKIVMEIKAKKILLKEDYYQLQRYLQILNMKLGLLINFRNRYLKPARIIRIDTDARKKFIQ